MITTTTYAQEKKQASIEIKPVSECKKGFASLLCAVLNFKLAKHTHDVKLHRQWRSKTGRVSYCVNAGNN